MAQIVRRPRADEIKVTFSREEFAAKLTLPEGRLVNVYVGTQVEVVMFANQEGEDDG